MRRTAFAGVVSLVASAAVLLAPVAVAGARVLRVGTYKGVAGQYKSIQAAVDAARPGDWVLVAPGDYKTRSVRLVPGRTNEAAGVLLTKPDVYLRGMNRNTVVVDGTKPGSPKCSSRKADQNFGPSSSGGPLGTERRPRLEGGGRMGAEPDRLQLPRRLRHVGQRASGGTAATAAARSAAMATTGRT